MVNRKWFGSKAEISLAIQCLPPPPSMRSLQPFTIYHLPFTDCSLTNLERECSAC
jgi:hypothetical protein